MAASTEPVNKLKIPGESTTKPSFVAPQIQTAPDVRLSQAVSGNAPAPNTSSTAGESQAAREVKIPTVSSQNVNAAKSAPPPNNTPTTPAAAKGPTVTSASATVPTSSGAPPGVPQTSQPLAATAPAPTTPPPPTVGLPPTMKSTQGKNAAEDDYLQAQNENAMQLYEAALTYNGGPTGALEQNALKAENSLRSATNARGAAGTIESSLYGNDKNIIATALATGDTAAAVKYQEAVNKANDALNKAQIAFQRANEQEKREIAEQAEKREQTEALEKEAAAGAASAPGGGVVPYESVQPGAGYVRVGMPQKPQRKGNGL